MRLLPPFGAHPQPGLIQKTSGRQKYIICKINGISILRLMTATIKTIEFMCLKIRLQIH